jgi:hypothetical protein
MQNAKKLIENEGRNDWWKKKLLSPAIIALGINLLCVFLIYSRHVPYNETNDDTGMTALLTNAYGSGSPHMVFSNVLYARLLLVLYSIFPEVNCYSLAQFFVIFVSFWIVGYLILSNCGRKFGIILYILLLRFFYQDFYLIYQFTRVAILCSVAGALWLIYSLQRRRWGQMVLAFCWTFLGTLIRYKSLISIGPIILCYGIFFVLVPEWKKSGNIQTFAKAVCPYICIVIVFLGAMFGSIVVDRNYYMSDGDWSEYLTYNRLRADILDYGWPSALPNYDDYEDEYKAIGISRADLELYSLGIMSDKENLPLEKLQSLLELKNKYTYSNWNIKEMAISYRNDLQSEPMLIFFSVLTILYMALSRSFVSCLFAIGNYGGMMLMYVYLFSLNRVVARAFHPIVLAASIALMCAWQPHMVRQVMMNIKQSIVLLISVLFCSATVSSPVYQQRKEEFEACQVDELYDIMANNTEDIYIAERRTFDRNYNFFDAFHVVPENFYSRQINIGGWLDRTPVFQKSAERLDIENFYREMIVEDNIYLYTIENEGLLEAYLKEHYNENISISIDRYCGTSPIIKFVQYIDNENILNRFANIRKITNYKIRVGDNGLLPDYHDVILNLEEKLSEGQELLLQFMFDDGTTRVFRMCRTDSDAEQGIFHAYVHRKYADDLLGKTVELNLYICES